VQKFSWQKYAFENTILFYICKILFKAFYFVVFKILFENILPVTDLGLTLIA